MRLKMMSGGDSVDYDVLTAAAGDVPEGLVFLGAGSEDEQVGTMPNMENLHGSPGYSVNNPDVPVHPAQIVRVTTDTAGRKQIALSPPHGVYPGTDLAFVGVTPEALGIIPERIANKQIIGGVTGEYGADGNLSGKDLRAGKVGYGANGRVPGSAVDYGAVSKTLSAGESYTIEEGIYSKGKVTAKDLASQTDGTATAAGMLENITAWVKGKLLKGTMKNVQAIDPAKSVVLSAGVLYARMTKGAHITDATSGYPEVSIPQATVANALGLTAAKLSRYQQVAGLTGTAYRSVMVNWSTAVSVSCTGYSGTASDRAVSIGAPYGDWDTVIMRVYPNTQYNGPLTIALSKGKSMRVPVTTIKWSDAQYRNAWVSISRSGSGEIKLAPFRGNESGTYTVVVEIIAVLDGTVVADE